MRGAQRRGKGPSGERVSRSVGEHTSAPRGGRRKDIREKRIEKRVAGAWGTPVRREKREREDYQRVRVTGLNKAVWPDPPGYHERKQREEENALKVKSAERQKPRPHRKTEDGTKDSK